MTDLPAIVTDIATVPEPVRGFYAEKDGRHVLRVAPFEDKTSGAYVALEDVGALKRAHGAEKEDRRKLAEKLAAFGEIDPKAAIDAIEWRKKFGDLDPAKEADKIAAAKFETLKEQLVEKHTSERQAIETERDALAGEVGRLLIDSAATREIADAGGLEGAPELLLPHVKARTRTRREGDQFVVEVLDEKGNPRIKDAQGNPFTIKDLVAEMREHPTFGLAFKGSGASGSGAGGAGARPAGAGGAGAPKHRDDFQNTAAKAAWVHEHGHDAFLKLPPKPRKAAA